MIAKYRIKEIFKITGRGLVLAGYIEDGEVSVGDYIEFAVYGKIIKRRISGIEGIRKVNSEKTNTGIFIECNNENEINELVQWRPKDDIGLITIN